MLSSQPLLKPIIGSFLTSLYGVTWIVTSTIAIAVADTAVLTKESIAQPLPLPPPSPPPSNEPVPVFTPPSTFTPDSGVLPRGYTPPPFTPDPSNQFNRYRLGIGDAIAITVPRFPEFSFQGAVSPEGDVIVPLVGRVSLLGLTLEEAEAKIAYLLGTQFLRTPPDVIATLAGARPVQVTIAGEVVRPGYYPLNPGSQLTAALLVAGGATQKADLRSVIVRRPLVDGSVIEKKVDLV
ncbi:MAG: polysaccharide biosynthesis/export family protein, partial [Chroococcales cyanobacterium]